MADETQKFSGSARRWSSEAQVNLDVKRRMISSLKPPMEQFESSDGQQFSWTCSNLASQWGELCL